LAFSMAVVGTFVSVAAVNSSCIKSSVDHEALVS
jgi:hypothetical protein